MEASVSCFTWSYCVKLSCVNTVSSFVFFQLNILLLQYREYGSNVKLLICFCVKKVQMVSVDRVHSELGLFMKWKV